MNVRIGIVGRGEIGSVLGAILERNGIVVSYWDTDPKKRTTSSVAELGSVADVVFLATPSQAVGESAAALPAVKRPAAVITLAKGVDSGFKTMDTVLQENAPTWARGLLYGPMLAEELSAGKATAALLALSDPFWHESLALAFAPQLKFETSVDIKSIALCGVLKNCYAITLGICDGLELGMNAKGALLVRILGEMEKILTSFGADPRAARGLAGLGDLFATGDSEFSANYTAGAAIACGTSEILHGEGANTLREASSAINLSLAPILKTTRAIVCDCADPKSIKELI